MTTPYPTVVAVEPMTALETVRVFAELATALVGLYVAYRRMTRTESQ